MSSPESKDVLEPILLPKPSVEPPMVGEGQVIEGEGLVTISEGEKDGSEEREKIEDTWTPRVHD